MRRFLDQLPARFEVGSGPIRVQGALVDVDADDRQRAVDRAHPRGVDRGVMSAGASSSRSLAGAPSTIIPEERAPAEARGAARGGSRCA